MNIKALNEDGSIKKGIYTHFKGNEKKYEVLGETRHSETLEILILYKALYKQENFPSGTLWIRPKDNFLEEVPEGRENPTKQKYRFELIKE